MAIPDDKIDEVRAAVDLVDVAGDYVQLKKSGQRFKGLCPFHNEKTPSFSVDPSKNLYYCFGCQAGGDAFKFVQEMEGIGFLEAVRMLAERYGISLPKEGEAEREATGEREAILHVLRFAARYFYRQLTQSDRGTPALRYLRNRGLRPKTITRFGLGYAPDAWDGLINAAAKKDIEPEMLEKAGLVIPRNSGDGYYDRYRGRIIFPIFSHIGKVLGFGGRILDADADQPKYINSPETKVYHKSEVLYGLYQGKQEIRREEEVMLVEGYTDVISLHQAGVPNVVASSGTSLTEDQVGIFDRYAKRVVLLYDGDEAGGRAAERGINQVLTQGLGAYVVLLPEGEDPDTFVREQGREAFTDYVSEHRMDVPSFKYRRAQDGNRLETPEDRVDVQRDIIASVSRMPDPNLRREYVRRTSEVVGVPDNALFRMLEEELQKRQEEEERRARREAKRRERESSPTPRSPSGGPPPMPSAPMPSAPPPTDDDFRGDASDPYGSSDGAYGGASDPDSSRPPEAQPAGPLPEEKLLLRLMLEHGTPMVEYVLGNMSAREFTEGPPRDMVTTLLEMYEEDDVEAKRILNSNRDDLKHLAAAVMMDEHEASRNWARAKNISIPQMNQHPFKAAEDAMTYLKLDRIKETIEDLKMDMRAARDAGDDDEMMQLQRKIMSLQTLQKQIEHRNYLEGPH